MAEEEGGVDETVLDEQRMSAISSRSTRSEQLQRAGKFAEAARSTLEDAQTVFASKNQQVKEKNAEVVIKAVCACSVRDDQTAALLEAISPDEADVLMKYIYKGLQRPDQSTTLLKLHGLLLEKAGLGCVVRSIVDRRQP